MTDLLYFILTLAAGYAGYLLFDKLKVNNGPMLGALCGVGILGLTTPWVVFYPFVKTVLQILSGAMIGSRWNRDSVVRFRKNPVNLLILLSTMLVFTVSLGLLETGISDMSLITALLSVSPGGLSDMTLIAGDLGGDTAIVMIMHLFRQIFLIAAMPIVITRIKVKKSPGLPAADTEDKTDGAKKRPAAPSRPVGEESRPAAAIPRLPGNLWLLILSGAAGGLLFNLAGIAGGAITGSILCSGVYCLFTDGVRFPSFLKTQLRVLIGAYNGSRLTMATLLALGPLVGPLLLQMLGLAATVMIGSALMVRFGKMDLISALFATSPGASSVMLLMAEEYNIDMGLVSFLQSFRLAFAIVVLPRVSTVISYFLG